MLGFDLSVDGWMHARRRGQWSQQERTEVPFLSCSRPSPGHLIGDLDLLCTSLIQERKRAGNKLVFQSKKTQAGVGFHDNNRFVGSMGKFPFKNIFFPVYRNGPMLIATLVDFLPLLSAVRVSWQGGSGMLTRRKFVRGISPSVKLPRIDRQNNSWAQTNLI